MRFVRTFFLAAALLGASAGFAHAAEPDLEEQIAAASTPAQHEAIAGEYRAKATEAREQAKRHRSMAARYGTAKMGMIQRPHCNKLAANFDDNATEYDALADGHAAEAKAGAN